MKGRMKEYVVQLPAGWQQLGSYLVSLADRLGNRVNCPAGLVIKAGGSALVKAGNRFNATISDGKMGRQVQKAANTDMAALSGTVVNATHNVFAFFIDGAGTLTSAMGVAGASLAAVKFPPVPVGKACIGYTHINPTGTGDFVGGTTPIDDATVVPNAIHNDIVGPFDPTIIP